MQRKYKATLKNGLDIDLNEEDYKTYLDHYNETTQKNDCLFVFEAGDVKADEIAMVKPIKTPLEKELDQAHENIRKAEENEIAVNYIETIVIPERDTKVEEYKKDIADIRSNIKQLEIDKTDIAKDTTEGKEKRKQMTSKIEALKKEVETVTLAIEELESANKADKESIQNFREAKTKNERKLKFLQDNYTVK